ncbi:MAG: hypothetical protein FJ279_36275 [Planctomycetes bacterium]|nr:hypothetical protein [Planctomycetota bacterium]
MRIKTSKDLATSLKGAAFRKVVCDGRSHYLREIGTMRNRGRRKPEPARGPARATKRGKK